MKLLLNILITLALSVGISLPTFAQTAQYAQTAQTVQTATRYEAMADSILAMCIRGEMEEAKGLLGKFRDEVEKFSSKTPALNNSKTPAETPEKQPSEAARTEFYQSWSNIVAYHFNRSEIVEAIEEVQRMQDFASRADDELGMACVAETYGGIYTYSFEESIRHLRRALDFWERTGNTNKTQYTLYMLSREALGLAETTDSAALRQQLYAQVLDYADRIETLAKEAAKDPGYIADYSLQLSEYLRIMAYLEQADQAKARASYDRLNAWWTEGKADRRIKGAMPYVMADYLIRYGNPDLAAPLIPLIRPDLQRLEMEKRLLLKKGDYARAAELQKQLDRLNRHRLNQLQQTQLAIANASFNNLRLEREKHQLEISAARRALTLNILIVTAFALLAIILAMLIAQRRILRKNRELVRRIQSQEEQERKTQSLAITMAESLSQEEQLFLRIERLLEEDIAVLTNADLDRDTLAAHLGTNRTYIAQAIAACADGITVSEYINRLRLQHARRLLTARPELSIDHVATTSGFGSRSRFHHLFVAQYGLTPAQFRKAAKG